MHIHVKGVLHRDIKLDNVVIDNMHITLIDFGFSRMLSKDQEVLYDYCGTPNYIAPEVAQREGYYGKPADIWSAGILLFKMATGAFPHKTIHEKDPNSKH